jgi:pimeloyl-ACP methyl ester carboxylesterase
MDALGLERAVLAGHSGSCLVARRVALDQPDRVSGLILEASPTTLRDDPGLRDFVATVVSGLDDPIDPDFARAVVVGTSSEAVPAEMVNDLAGELLKVPSRVWREIFAELLLYDDTAELSRIIAPTLLLWGTADDLVPRSMQDRLLALIPAAALITYEGVGHTPRWDAPARVAADIAAFIQSLAR